MDYAPLYKMIFNVSILVGWRYENLYIVKKYHPTYFILLSRFDISSFYRCFMDNFTSFDVVV